MEFVLGAWSDTSPKAVTVRRHLDRPSRKLGPLRTTSMGFTYTLYTYADILQVKRGINTPWRIYHIWADILLK